MSGVIADPPDRPLPSSDEATVRLVAARYAEWAAEPRRVQSLLTGALISELGWPDSARLAFDETVRVRSRLIGPVAPRYDASAGPPVRRRSAGVTPTHDRGAGLAAGRGTTGRADLLASSRAEAERPWTEWGRGQASVHGRTGGNRLGPRASIGRLLRDNNAAIVSWLARAGDRLMLDGV
jgi:hypothetical protein